MDSTETRFDFAPDRIVETVVALCAEHGYREINGEHVAQHLGSTTGLDSDWGEVEVERCLVTAENALLADVATAVSGAYSPDRSEWENVVHGVLAILELLAEKPATAHLGTTLARQMAPPEVNEIYKSGHRMLTAMLDRGWVYSTQAAQPSTASTGSLGGAEALLRREISAGRATGLPQHLPALVYGATVAFLGQEEAMRLARSARDLIRDTRWDPAKP